MYDRVQTENDLASFIIENMNYTTKELMPWQLDIIKRIMYDMDPVMGCPVAKDPGHSHSYTVGSVSTGSTLYSFAPNTYPAGCVSVPCQQKENDMNSAYATVAVEANPTKDERRFLRSRLEDAFYTKKAALKVKFGLIDDEAPASFEDFLARIQAGKYTIDDKDAKKKTWNPTAYIRWRDPSVKEDQEGYDAAKATLKAAYDKAEEDIRILTPTEGLAALRAFKDISVQ